MMGQTKEILGKSYDAKEVESRWYNTWIDAKLFAAHAANSLPYQKPLKKSYVVIMPPPNVTGALHNGHALFVTLQDILVRYHRMLGENTLWLPGIDHAGIATQTVVERELTRTQNATRHAIGRKAFLEHIWQWKEKNGSRIIEQLKMMGASADWDRCRFTMDEGCSVAVKTAFVQLWNEGLIYRGERLVNWDPAFQTALSEEEVEHVTREGELWHFAYLLKNKPGKEIVVATTRPETMLGDTAVAVHPDDKRYHNLIGEALVHPFFPERELQIIADETVQIDFGSGAVKITPAHDPDDFLMGNRHNLPRINVLTREGKINEQGGIYFGFDRFEAREKIKQDLINLGLFRGSEKIEHNVSISQRSGVDIEPMLSRQYFVRTQTMAKKAYDAVESGETRIIPASWKKTWDHFLLNIQDWCISRQLWWGHQIPVFYDVEKLKIAINADARAKRIQTESLKALDSGETLKQIVQIALNELSDQAVQSFSVASLEDLASKHGEDRFIQEEDVLDTWFSSGLWPFSTLGWPENTDDLKAFYPSAVLETGFDILFFWVARMMMFGIHFMKRAPFKDIYLHAMVRDSHGRKMSKSLGNAIDPVDVIDGISLDNLLSKTKNYPVPVHLLPQVLNGIQKDYPAGIPASGADGLRFSLAILSGQGRDVKLALPRIAGYRAFLNKIWNASRFVLMRIGSESVFSFSEIKANLEIEDRWILSRLQKTIQAVETGIEKYQFSEAAERIYQFFWSEFCDWYIEFAKLRLNPESDPQKREAARTVLVELLDTSMRLLHPFCPFISEEIWQKLPHKAAGFCAVSPFPKADSNLIDADAEKSLNLVQSVIGMIRNTRQESNLPAQKKIPAILLTSNSEHLLLLQSFSTAITRIALLDSLRIEPREGFVLPKLAAVNADAFFEIILPLEGVFDLGNEKKRLEKGLEKIKKEAVLLNIRLDDASFVAKAPAEVILQHQKQLEELQQKKYVYEKRLDELISLRRGHD
jgi:valyl-tRNA synthetase